MSTSDAWEIKQGDRLPAYSATLLENGAPLDLSSASAVRFTMRQASGAKRVSADAVIVDPAAGRVRYDWASDDTDTVDLYRQEWKITWPGGYEQTVPNDGYNSVRVVADLG